MKYKNGQTLVINDEIIITDDGDNLLMLKGTQMTIQDFKEDVYYPYIVKFNSHNGYEMAMTEQEITDLTIHHYKD